MVNHPLFEASHVKDAFILHYLNFSLTVMEHLQFYAQLKGLDKELVMKESEQMISDLGLPHKRDEVAKNLSGKRKDFQSRLLPTFFFLHLSFTR